MQECAGADINKEDKEGRTALMNAAGQNHVGSVECLKELLAALGTDSVKEVIAAQNNRSVNTDQEPLISAVESRKIESVEELLKY